jgi:hypothetical protein
LHTEYFECRCGTTQQYALTTKNLTRVAALCAAGEMYPPCALHFCLKVRNINYFKSITVNN